MVSGVRFGPTMEYGASYEKMDALNIIGAGGGLRLGRICDL